MPAARKFYNHVLARAVRLGVPPSWLRYRVVLRQQFSEPHATTSAALSLTQIHAPGSAQNPLPVNVHARCELPSDRGWWGYSFRDVPERRGGGTMLARGRECLVVPYRDGRGEFWVTVLDGRGRWLDLREMQLREFHREVLRRADRQRHASGVWILERVYHNYSHWLTAHLPKLLLLRELEIPGPIFMPRQRPEFIEECLRLFGFTPGQFCDFDEARVLEVGELSVLSTDRFRPELLQLIRKWCPRLTEAVPTRRIFISRRHSERRRLLNEDELWPMLQRAGFERVAMEQYSFTEQVKLMQESAVICAPHGAGLTNMLFAPPGAHVIEMADLSFPNPNFYASACAMGHHYWLVAATGVGDVHPLEKDLEVSPGVLEDVLSRMDNASATRNADAGG